MGASLYKYSTVVKDFDPVQGTITAYASAFGNKDFDGDTIFQGAYAKTISERGPNGTQQIKMLLMHQDLIGKVLRIEEDDFGLLFQAKLVLEDNPPAQKAFALYKADLFEHSVGIDVIRPEQFRGGDIFEVKLFDVSPVIWGANDQTPTVSVKSFFDEPDHITGRIRKLRKAIDFAESDEVAVSLNKDLDTGLALLEAQVAVLAKAAFLPQVDNENVLQGVLAHLKANPNAPITSDAAGQASTSDAGTPQIKEKWLREVLTHLRNHA